MRARAAALLDRAKVFEAVLWARARMPVLNSWLGDLLVLTYHHLHDVGPDYPFDKGVVDASPAAFDEQMAFVARWFTPVGIDELRAAVNGGALPPNAIAVTFDDGYKSNLELAVPILKRHGIRATFFFATGFLTDRRVFWWDRIAYLIKKSRRERIAIHYPTETVLALGSPEACERAIYRLLRIVKEEVGLDLERFILGLTEATGVAWDAALERKLADELLLTWDEVRAIRAAGFDVQSHTKTHRPLRTITDAEIRLELADSRAELERQLGEKVSAVSYPCGIHAQPNDPIFDKVREAGYEIGFASNGGVNARAATGTRPHHLARIALDYGTPMSLFRGTLALPAFVR